MRSPAAPVLTWTLALHLVVVGLAAAIGELWPPEPSDLLWRVAFQSQLLAATGQFLAAAAVLLGFAFWSRSSAAALGALVIAVAVPIFVGVTLATLVLDYVQVRAGLRPDALTRSDLGVVVPGTGAILASAVLLVLSGAALGVRGK